MPRVILIELFSLEPIGIGTAAVESLTSYLTRLAEAHCVTVGTLIGKVVAKELGKEYLLESSKHGGSRFYEQGPGLNGLGKQATDLSSALYNLTGCDVSSLTVQSWRDIIPATALLRKYKAWCPICLDDWKNNHNPIYEPLIWNFKLINVCGNHGALLNTHCPLCGSEIPVLSRKTRNGYCSFCGCWLGSQNAYYHDKESAHPSWDCFVVSNIGNLLGGVQLQTNYFTDFIENLISKAGGLTAFSQYFNIAKSTVSEWSNGLHKPSLLMLLQLCYSLGLNVLDLGKPFALPDKNNANMNENTMHNHGRRRIDWNAVQTTLTEIICHSNIRTPSLREVARELRIDKRSLYYHFSELCNEISRNHSIQIHMMKNNRIEDGYEKIKDIITDSYSIGEYPSRRTIEKALPSSIILRERAFKDYWKTLT